MKALTFIEARNPEYSSENNSTIDIEVKWREFDEWLPFTASLSDEWPQGPYLFRRAEKGDFGKVKAYTPKQED